MWPILHQRCKQGNCNHKLKGRAGKAIDCKQIDESSNSSGKAIIKDVNKEFYFTSKYGIQGILLESIEFYSNLLESIEIHRDPFEYIGIH